MDLREIERKVSNGMSIEEAIGETDWRGFEDICSKILEENGWKTRKNYRFKTERRYEIDILAERNGDVLLIDCKQWGQRPGKSTQLRASARKQLERMNEWKRINFLERIDSNLRPIPMVVTWFEEGIREEEGVWIIPVFKLNTFLLELGEYIG